MSFTAETPIAEIASLDKKLLKNLPKIGYTKVNDLLSHYPKRYENREQFNEFPYEPTESPICFKGEVIDSSRKFYGRRRFFEALISDSEDGRRPFACFLEGLGRFLHIGDARTP